MATFDPNAAQDVIYVTGGSSSGGAAHMSQYDLEGNLLARINGNGINGVGGAVDPETRDPYWTNFSNGTVLTADHDGLTNLRTYINGTGDSDCESLVFRDEWAYVGHADGNGTIRRFNKSDGTFNTFYSVGRSSRGSDHCSLHPDNRTMYYTSESGRVLRYDVEARAQLSDFANTGQTNYGINVRQSDEHVFVVGGNKVFHYDPLGVLLDQWTPQPSMYGFSMGMSIDERYVYVGDYQSPNLWRIEIATGDGTATPFVVQPGGSSYRTGGIFAVGGTAIFVEATGSRVHYW